VFGRPEAGRQSNEGNLAALEGLIPAMLMGCLDPIEFRSPLRQPGIAVPNMLAKQTTNRPLASLFHANVGETVSEVSGSLGSAR
jgi:hypothetical protein